MAGEGTNGAGDGATVAWFVRDESWPDDGVGARIELDDMLVGPGAGEGTCGILTGPASFTCCGTANYNSRHEFMNTLWTKMTVRNLGTVGIRGYIMGQSPARLAVRTTLPGWFDHLAKTLDFLLNNFSSNS